MVVTCAGMYRSASTLSYNIAKTIIEKAGLGYPLAYPGVEDINKKEIIISKCHEIDPKWGVYDEKYWRQFYCIYTFRDIRDVMASFCIWRNMTLKDFDFQGNTARSMITWLLDMDDRWRSMEKLLLLKYKDHVPYGKREIGILAYKISSFLKIDVSAQNYSEIADRFNIDSMKQISDNLLEGDKTTLLNPNHIKDGKPGKWKTQFTEEEKQEYFFSNNRLMEWLSKYKFEI